MMYSTASPMPPVNTYKNGKISQGGGGFMRDMLITTAAAGTATANDYPHRTCVAGEKLWVTGLAVQKDGIVFQLYSDSYGGIRYYGQLKFPFEKGSVPTPDQAMARIAEALTVQSADNSVQAAPAPTQLASGSDPVPPSPPPPPPAALKLPATYVSAQAPADQLSLNADSSFSLQEAGQTYRGTFVVNGSTLELNISETNTKTTVSMQGTNLTDGNGQTWVLREQPSPSAPSAAFLQNQDVVKMAKAGVSDDLIILKIGSSRCQFDTSPDALIQLKQGGVSAPVIMAMLRAGK